MSSSQSLLTLHNSAWYGIADQSSTGPVLVSILPTNDKARAIQHVKDLQKQFDYKGYVLVQLMPLFQDTPGYQPPFPSASSTT